jgi:hypothetical protein
MMEGAVFGPPFSISAVALAGPNPASEYGPRRLSPGMKMNIAFPVHVHKVNYLDPESFLS